MLEGHRRLILKTTTNESIEVEVNFSNLHAANDCKIIRFRRDGVSFDVKRDELVSLLLMIGSEQNQKDLMPVRYGSVRKIERLLGFKFSASKDYKKGDEIHIAAPWIDEIPTEQEMMSGSLDRTIKKVDTLHKNTFLIPKR